MLAKKWSFEKTTIIKGDLRPYNVNLNWRSVDSSPMMRLRRLNTSWSKVKAMSYRRKVKAAASAL
jgi:GMP synthase PP-ATPase subunit